MSVNTDLTVGEDAANRAEPHARLQGQDLDRFINHSRVKKLQNMTGKLENRPFRQRLGQGSLISLKKTFEEDFTKIIKTAAVILEGARKKTITPQVIKDAARINGEVEVFGVEEKLKPEELKAFPSKAPIVRWTKRLLSILGIESPRVSAAGGNAILMQAVNTLIRDLLRAEIVVATADKKTVKPTDVFVQQVLDKKIGNQQLNEVLTEVEETKRVVTARPRRPRSPSDTERAESPEPKRVKKKRGPTKPQTSLTPAKEAIPAAKDLLEEIKTEIRRIAEMRPDRARARAEVIALEAKIGPSPTNPEELAEFIDSTAETRKKRKDIVLLQAWRQFM